VPLDEFLDSSESILSMLTMQLSEFCTVGQTQIQSFRKAIESPDNGRLRPSMSCLQVAPEVYVLELLSPYSLVVAQCQYGGKEEAGFQGRTWMPVLKLPFSSVLKTVAEGKARSC